MNIENELPELFDELAADHEVGAPPALDGRAVPLEIHARPSKRVSMLAAAAACCAVLVVGLVAVGTRSAEAPINDASAAEPLPSVEDGAPTSSGGGPSLPLEDEASTSPGLSLVRIETRAADDKTTQLVVVFDGDLPDTSVSLLASAATPLSTSVGYTTQDSSTPPTDVIVCDAIHSFGPGNQTVDVFVPIDWFDGPPVTENGVANNVVPVVPQAGSETSPKIVLCEHRAGALQIAVWGAASGRTDDVDVTVEANTITIDITPDPTHQFDETTIGAGVSTVDGPLIRWAEPPESDEGMMALVSGVLELDAGCLYLVQGDADERSPVLWPFGTTWNSDDESVVLPNGTSVAMGESVTGSGGYLGARMVRQLADGDAAEVVSACADNRSGEAAIFNNLATAVEPA